MANKVAGFIKEVRVELGKVSWATRNELIASTVVVIASTLLLALFIGVCDFILLRIVSILIR